MLVQLLKYLSKLSSSRNALLLCFLVCVVGCLLQIIFLNADFFQFKIISVREIKPLNEEDIPGFTICQRKMDLLLNQDHLCQNLTQEQCVYKVFVDSPISEQHLNTYSPINYIKECWIPVNLSDKVDCNRILKITPYITGNEKCFAFHRPFGYESLESVKYKHSRPLIILLNREIFLYKQAWKLSLAFHDLTVPLHYLDLTWKTLRPNQFTATDLSYDVEKTQQINFWVKYKCIDYSKNELKSKSNCYNICFIQKCRKLKNAWPSQVPGFIDNYLNITEIDTKRQILEECEKKCGDNTKDNLECESSSYRISIINEQTSDSDNTKLFTIKIFPPKYKVYYKNKFQTDFLHYGCFVASCISLWLGISISTVLAYLLEYKLKNLFKMCM